MKHLSLRISDCIRPIPILYTELLLAVMALVHSGVWFSRRAGHLLFMKSLEVGSSGLRKK